MSRDQLGAQRHGRCCPRAVSGAKKEAVAGNSIPEPPRSAILEWAKNCSKRKGRTLQSNAAASDRTSMVGKEQRLSGGPGSHAGGHTTISEHLEGILKRVIRYVM